MARKTEDENALRASVNEINGIFNQHFLNWAEPPSDATITLVHDKLLHIWNTYFSDSRVEGTDTDILNTLCRFPFLNWPESIILEAYTEIGRAMKGPVISMVNTHRLKE